jgi:hypothetical protein
VYRVQHDDIHDGVQELVGHLTHVELLVAPHLRRLDHFLQRFVESAALRLADDGLLAHGA